MSCIMMCRFTFEDKQYEVTDEAYAQFGHIRLPDGRVLEVGGWFECMPPKPGIVGVTTDTSRPIFDAVAV